MKNVTYILIVAVAATFTASAAAPVQANDFGWGPIQIDIPGVCPKPCPRPVPQCRYSVTLYHPISGGVVWSTIATSQSQATQIANNYRRQHWKIWKYNGIGQELHSRQFSSYYAAEKYEPPKKLLGFNKRYVRAGKVSVQKL
ncbi:hypothetical protein GC197_13390 [bacterium]|nr:hypothetical protein [bacterium]